MSSIPLSHHGPTFCLSLSILTQDVPKRRKISLQTTPDRPFHQRIAVSIPMKHKHTAYSVSGAEVDAHASQSTIRRLGSAVSNKGTRMSGYPQPTSVADCGGSCSCCQHLRMTRMAYLNPLNIALIRRQRRMFVSRRILLQRVEAVTHGVPVSSRGVDSCPSFDKLQYILEENIELSVRGLRSPHVGTMVARSERC